MKELDLGSDLRDKSGMIAAAANQPADTPQLPPDPVRRRPTLELRRRVRLDFVQGRGSYASVARKYGLRYDTLKAWAKREKWSELRTAFETSELERLQVLPVPPPMAIPTLTPQESRIARVEKELERLELAMDKAHAEDGTCNAATLRDISAAHSRLFDVWCTLTGTPRPGVRKTVKPGRSLAPIVAPTESTAQAVESQPLPE
jgi:transposase-like protein